MMIWRSIWKWAREKRSATNNFNAYNIFLVLNNSIKIRDVIMDKKKKKESYHMLWISLSEDKETYNEEKSLKFWITWSSVIFRLRNNKKPYQFHQEITQLMSIFFILFLICYCICARSNFIAIVWSLIFPTSHTLENMNNLIWKFVITLTSSLKKNVENFALAPPPRSFLPPS